MTKEQLIAQFKAQFPTLTYGINDEVFEMSAEQYEQTIEKWADIEFAKIQAELEAQAKRSAALAKLEALGLDEDDLKAIGL